MKKMYSFVLLIAAFLCSISFAQTQMDLPVTFDDPTVNYSTIDFGGTMSSVVVDPTNAANMVVQTEKTAGAQTWAGTTLAIPGPGGPNVDTGFLNPIPFVAGSTTMTVRVWSTGPGLPVRLKVEQQTNNTITCETEALTTATGAWETLTFDFSNPAAGTAALNFANTYNMASLFYNFGTGGSGQVFYWDDVQFGGTPGGPCAGVIPDATILDDFECQGNITYTFANATWTEDVPNPNPTGLNTSSKVGEFIHWGAGTDGAFGGNLNLAPIDLAASNGELKIDVHPSAIGLPITVVFQDAGGADIAIQTVSTSVAGAWETLSFDMSAAIGTNVSSVVFVVSPGDSVQHVVYFDNIRLDTVTVVVPCAGVTPDPNVFDDFECQGNITYTFANATWTEDVANPNPTGLNTSAMVGEFIHWGAGTDGAFGGSLDLAPLDLSVLGSDLKMDVHPSAVGLPITVVFQDAGGADIALQTATTTVAGAWETLSFDMSAASSTNVSAIVFVVSPGDTVQHVVYFDNIRLDTSSIVATCPGVAADIDIMEDFECQRNTNYTLLNGNLSVIANPDQSGINTSAAVGRYIRSNAVTDEVRGNFTLAPLDFTNNNVMQLDVWDANPPTEVTIILQDASGIYLETAVKSTKVGNTWEQLKFDFSTVPFTIGVSRVIVQFDANSAADSTKIYYFDNFEMGGLATGINDLNVGSLNAYPNPTEDFFNLDLSDLNLLEELKVSIVSMDGKLLSSEMLINPTNELRLDLRSLESGVYIVELASSNQTWINKVIKK